MPEKIPQSMNIDQLWTRDKVLQQALREQHSFLGKLAFLANRSKTSSVFALQNSKIKYQDFSGPITFLNIANGELKDTLLSHKGFMFLSKNAEARQRKYQGPQIGSALEMFFIDVSHLIFGTNFVGEVAATLDDLNYQTDAFFLEQPFQKTKFLFGLDFTINASNNPYRENGVDRKIRQIIQGIQKDPEKFNVMYVHDRENDSFFSASNVPKLVCYINPNFLEELAKLYYNLEHEKLDDLILKIRVEIIESLAMQAYIFAKYAKVYGNAELFNTYYRLYRRLKQLTNKERITLNRNSQIVGQIDQVLYTLNPKRALSKN